MIIFHKYNWTNLEASPSCRIFSHEATFKQFLRDVSVKITQE